MRGGVRGKGRPRGFAGELIAERVRRPVRIGRINAGTFPGPVLRLVQLDGLRPGAGRGLQGAIVVTDGDTDQIGVGYRMPGSDDDARQHVLDGSRGQKESGELPQGGQEFRRSCQRFQVNGVLKRAILPSLGARVAHGARSFDGRPRRWSVA